MNMMTSTAVVAATAKPLTAGPTEDPIFAAIREHKQHRADHIRAVDDHCKLDEELPFDLCRSRITAWEETIVETDDPRWIAAERDVDRTCNAADEAACQLVTVKPTTIAGVIALLTYVTGVEAEDKEVWPTDTTSVASAGGSWSYLLHQSLAKSLQTIIAGRRSLT